jgi:hypothetical protein
MKARSEGYKEPVALSARTKVEQQVMQSLPIQRSGQPTGAKHHECVLLTGT